MPTFVPLLLMLWSLSPPALAQTHEPEAAAHIDVQRYMGEWYEIARLPNRLERSCASDVTATYERRSEEAIRVTYMCRDTEGEAVRIRGVARVRDIATDAKLEMRFAPLALAWWPFVWDDWWILEVDDGYTQMMVGDPSHDTLWIFARTRDLDAAAYQTLVAHAAAQGYDTSKLVRTRQSVH